MRDALNQIRHSGDYDIPGEVLAIMKRYEYRHFRYFTPLRPYQIHDLNQIPTYIDPSDLSLMNPDRGLSSNSTWGRIPDDGTCLNLIIE